LLALTTFLHEATNHHVIVNVTDFDGTFDGVLDTVVGRLTRERTTCLADPNRSSGRSYYRGLSFKMSVNDGDEVVEVGDDGLTDWTATLLNNAKERIIIGGVSLDRLSTMRFGAEGKAASTVEPAGTRRRRTTGPGSQPPRGRRRLH